MFKGSALDCLPEFGLVPHNRRLKVERVSLNFRKWECWYSFYFKMNVFQTNYEMQLVEDITLLSN